jgi:hypothetical protein
MTESMRQINVTWVKLGYSSMSRKGIGNGKSKMTIKLRIFFNASGMKKFIPEALASKGLVGV